LVDKGTAMRSYTKNGKVHPTGSVSRGRPYTGSNFFTDAVQQEGPKALNNLVNIVERELKKMMG
jgi:hypothetical protein